MTCKDVRVTTVAVVVIDGLPLEMIQSMRGELPFLRDRTPHMTSAVSCFPSTTGPAYFPFLAGSSPGRANITGIRWFDRSHPTRTRFPHRGLRSYVGPDAGKMTSDTALRTIFHADAWPASSPVAKDIPKRREKSRDVLWAFAHFTERWDIADRRTNWKLGRALGKGRPIVFAVFPSVDEYGHTIGLGEGHAEEALVSIDRMLAETLAGFEGEVLVSADHGLTTTTRHIDLRAVIERMAGSTIAFPLIAKPNPAAVVCESGNAMANVYLRGDGGWGVVPPVDRCRELAAELTELEGVDSVAIRGDRSRHRRADHRLRYRACRLGLLRLLAGRRHLRRGLQRSRPPGVAGPHPARGVARRALRADQPVRLPPGGRPAGLGARRLGPAHRS